jgi:hypothetical protein
MSYPELPSGLNSNWEDTGTVHLIYNISPFIGEHTATEAVLTYAGSPAVTLTGHQARGVYGGTIRILFSGTIGVGASAPVVAWRITNWDTTRFPFYNAPPVWLGSTRPVESDTINSLVPANAASLVVGGGTGRNFRLFRAGSTGRITTFNFSDYDFPATTANPFTIVSSNGERNGTAYLTTSEFLWGVFPNLTPGRTYLQPTISQESFSGSVDAPVITGRLNDANPQPTVPPLANTTTLAADAIPIPSGVAAAAASLAGAPNYPGYSYLISCEYGDGTTQTLADSLVNCVRITATLLNTPPVPLGSPPQAPPTAIAPITLYYRYNLVNSASDLAYIGSTTDVPGVVKSKLFPTLPVAGTYLFQVSFGATGDYDSYFAGGGTTYAPDVGVGSSVYGVTTPPPNTGFGAPAVFRVTWTPPAPITVPPPVPTITAIDGGLVDVTALDGLAVVNSGSPTPFPAVTAAGILFRFQASVDGGATFTSTDSTSFPSNNPTAQLSLNPLTSYLIRSAARNPTLDGTDYQIELFSDWIEVDTQPATPLTPGSPVDSATAYSGNSTNTVNIVANAFTGGAGVKTYRINWLFTAAGAPAPLPEALTNVTPALYSAGGTVTYTIPSAPNLNNTLPPNNVPQLSPWNLWWTITATDESAATLISAVQSLARAAQTTPNAPNELIPAAAYGGLVIVTPGADPSFYRMVLPPGAPNPQVGVPQQSYNITQSFWSEAQGNTTTMGFIFKTQGNVTFGEPPFPGVDGQPELGGFVDFTIPTGGVVNDIMETQLYPRTYAQTNIRTNFPTSPVFTPNSYAELTPGNGLRTPSLLTLLNLGLTVTVPSTNANGATASWDLGYMPPFYSPSPGDPDEIQGISYAMVCVDSLGNYPDSETPIPDPTGSNHLTSTIVTNLVPNNSWVFYPKIYYAQAGGVFTKSVTRTSVLSGSGFTTNNPTFALATFTFTPGYDGFAVSTPYVQPGGTNPVAGSSTGSTLTGGDTFLYTINIYAAPRENPPIATYTLVDVGGAAAFTTAGAGALTPDTFYYYQLRFGTAANGRQFYATSYTLFQTTTPPP